MPIFLTIEQVVKIHDAQIARYGGDAGLRDPGLLESAVNQPLATMFGEFLHPRLPDQAAAYLYHLALNHAFMDGNKRTGFVAAVVFLDLNGYPASQRLLTTGYELTMAVVAGELSKESLSASIAELIGWTDEEQGSLLPAAAKDFWLEINKGIVTEIGLSKYVDNSVDAAVLEQTAAILRPVMFRYGMYSFRALEPGARLGLGANGDGSWGLVFAPWEYKMIRPEQHSAIMSEMGVPPASTQKIMALSPDERAAACVLAATKGLLSLGLAALVARFGDSLIGIGEVGKQANQFCMVGLDYVFSEDYQPREMDWSDLDKQIKGANW